MLREVLARLRARVLLLRARLLVLRRVRALDVDLVLRDRLALEEPDELGLGAVAPPPLE